MAGSVLPYSWPVLEGEKTRMTTMVCEWKDLFCFADQYMHLDRGFPCSESKGGVREERPKFQHATLRKDLRLPMQTSVQASLRHAADSL